MWTALLVCLVPDYYGIVAWRITLFYRGALRRFPLSTVCCVFVCVHECASDLLSPDRVCVSASRNAANEREEGACRGQEQGQNNTGCQESVREWVHVCLTIPLTSFCWEPESENACVHETSQASLLIGRNKCVSVCVCILSVTMPPPHTHFPHKQKAQARRKQQLTGRCERAQ